VMSSFWDGLLTGNVLFLIGMAIVEWRSRPSGCGALGCALPRHRGLHRDKHGRTFVD
jgi:hypothetical protein